MTMQTDDMSATGENGTDRLKEAAGGVASEAGRAAETRASETMTQIGDTLEQLAQAVRDAGSGIREQQPQVASVADTAAGQVERASQYLREHDAREALDAAQDFARRQPLAVAAGGLALGLVVGRLLKTAGSAGSASRSSRVGPGTAGWDREGYRSYRGTDYGRASYAGGTYGGSTFGGSTVGTTDPGSASAVAGVGGAGASTLASGEPIEPGGAIDTGQAGVPTGYSDGSVVGRSDSSADEGR
jgi:ElaB/YqjD/DUF883 family membrane-anchored ribosome-binding protein